MAKHFIITNRQVSLVATKGSIKVNAKEYLRTDGAEEAQDNLRYGEVRFDEAASGATGEYEIQLYPDLNHDQMERYKEDAVLPSGFKFGSQRVFDALHQKGMRTTKSSADTLVFIHGFNTDLDVAMRTMVELHERYVVPVDSPIQNIVMFTWPAKRNVLKYRDDARDATKSGYAVARAFCKLREQFMELAKQAYRSDQDLERDEIFCSHQMHLLCHSMGNRVVEAMMAELNVMGERPNNMFGEIFLMAADVDDDALEPQKPMHDLIAIGKRVHIYYHQNDRALGVSEKTKNAFNRLGRWGARRTLPLPDEVYQAEVTYVADEVNRKDRAVHHWYYLNSPTVVRDVIDVLNGKVTIFNF